MKTNLYTKTYTDRRLLFPLFKIYWQKLNKILTIKLGIWKWTFYINFNF